MEISLWFINFKYPKFGVFSVKSSLHYHFCWGAFTPRISRYFIPYCSLRSIAIRKAPYSTPQHCPNSLTFTILGICGLTQQISYPENPPSLPQTKTYPTSFSKQPWITFISRGARDKPHVLRRSRKGSAVLYVAEEINTL